MNPNNLYADFADDIANLEFQKTFYHNFPKSKLHLCSDSLQYCLKQVSDERKPLIFLLHDDNDQFSQKCCEQLTETQTEDFICEKFSILGWKISYGSEHFIKDLADKILIVEEIGEYIYERRPCIFIIIPNICSVKVQERIEINKENIENKILLPTLRKVEKLLSSYITEDYFKTMTAVKYQQYMYDELGDRDYDSFEPDESELLKKKLLYSMYGPPKELKDDTIGYEKKQIEEVEKIYQKIREKNNEYSKWDDRVVMTFIYNCIEPTAADKDKKAKNDEAYKPEQDFCPVPIFVLRKCKARKDQDNNTKRSSPCRLFIDTDCRVYDTWENYLENNKLPPRKMIYPVGGRYCSKQDSSDVLLEEKASPSCGMMSTVLKAADIGSGLAGFLSGATLVAAMFTPAAAVAVPVALAAGGTTGVYAASRGTATLVDRGKHEQSVNIKNPESRGAYLNILTGVIGTVGLGATKLLTESVRSGANIGRSTVYAVNAINGANIVISGTATVNSFYDVYQQYVDEGQRPSTLTILQLGSSLFFFGNAVVNFRTAGTIINEVQSNTINEISEGLRSNRHRKTFNKLLKESIRTQGSTKGRAEIISSMRNAATRDDVLAVLTRNNKHFNKNGIRFASEGGGITLNGVPVDILEFGNLPKMQQGVLFEQLPSIPENHSPGNINYTTKLVQNMKLNENLELLFKVAACLDPTKIVNVLIDFEQNVQEKILRICEIFMNQMGIEFIVELRKLFTGDFKSTIIKYVVDFVMRYATKYKEEFEKRLLNEDVLKVCKAFGFANPHVTINNFINYVVDKFVDKKMMETLMTEFKSWFASELYHKEMRIKKKGRRHAGLKKEKQDCPICGGYYYVV